MEEKEKLKQEAKIVEVATQTAPAIELEDGAVVNELTLLVRMYNDIQKLKKAIIQ